MCRTTCERAVCTPFAAPPVISEAELDEQLAAMFDELLTADGLIQLAAEEAVEEALEYAAGLAAWAKARGLKRLITRYLRYKSVTRVAPMGAIGRAATGSALPGILKSSSNATIRSAIKSAKLKLSKFNAKWGGSIFFALQVLGMVLDIDDAAGFNTQVPQGGVDITMAKMLQVINGFPEMQDAGVQFPREYRPEYTLDWARLVYNEVVINRHTDLSLDYLDRLVLNSNGERIAASWDEFGTARSEAAEAEAAAAAAALNKSILWKLSGQNPDVHTGLKRWWWLLLVLILVILLTLGLGLGLGLRKRKAARPIG